MNVSLQSLCVHSFQYLEHKWIKTFYNDGNSTWNHSLSSSLGTDCYNFQHVSCCCFTIKQTRTYVIAVAWSNEPNVSQSINSVARELEDFSLEIISRYYTQRQFTRVHEIFFILYIYFSCYNMYIFFLLQYVYNCNCQKFD